VPLLGEEALVATARDLGGRLPAGSIVWLEGELGAGKTTFARALAQGLGALREAASPTFGLVHCYPGTRGAVYHVDCFRLRHPEEAGELDWGTMAGGAALLIEWPGRAGEWAPAATCTVRLTHVDDPALRRVEIR
jgi:tRNA threonylcarbamoyladenosine biosynthesis protein TsaE